MFKLPEEANLVIERLNRAGYEAYIVGGCVRDFLLHKIPKDYDITTSALPEEIKDIFTHTIDTGIKHGTVTVLIGKKSFEVTTYRIDGEYKDCRHPESVVFTSEIEKDLLRRDFTMNAIAYHPKLGLVDPYNGQKDIKNKAIRGVGDPEKRFDEDTLRVLRALRFAAVLGFEIEEKTFLAVCKKAHLIKNISWERIHDEFIKLLSGAFPEKISLLWETPMLKSIDEPLYKDIISNKWLINELKASAPDKNLRLLLFFGSYTGDLKELLRKMRFDNKSIFLLTSSASLLGKEMCSELEIKKIIFKSGKESVLLALLANQIKDVKNAKEAIEMYNKVIIRGDPLCLKDMKLSGKDIIDMGVPQGEEVKKILESLFTLVLYDPSLNKRETLKNMAKEYMR